MNPPEAQVPGAQIRVGCDVVSLGEIKHSLSAFGQRFLDKIYTADEQAACAGPDQVARLAARFAAKEAAIKAFSQPDAAFAPREIEIVTTARLPALRLFGAAAMLAAEQAEMDEWMATLPSFIPDGQSRMRRSRNVQK